MLEFFKQISWRPQLGDVRKKITLGGGGIKVRLHKDVKFSSIFSPFLDQTGLN